jgi:pyrimidine-specific ribonucleoside hydrolase
VTDSAHPAMVISGELTPVIIDCDTGIDDAFAIMFAVRHPGIDLRAVTCVAGNTGVDRVVANTRYVLDAAGAGELPVGRGAATPLLDPAQDAGHFHGSDGLGGFSRPSDRRSSPLGAVELLRHELLAAVANGEPITLVATGPLTNVALLLRAHPEVAAGIERLLFMGGSASTGNVTAVAEFNIFHDPEAAAITLAAARDLDIPVTMYGLDVFEQVLVDRQDAARLTDRLDPACQLAGALIAGQCDRLDTDAITIGDAGTLCAIVDPDGLTTQSLPVRVETGQGCTRGQTVVDRRADPTDHVRSPTAAVPPTRVDVALAVDARGYAGLWLQTLIG